MYDSMDAGYAKLAQKPLSMHNPGGALLSLYYPSPYNTEHHVARSLNKMGNIRIAGNNTNLGATSNFTISSSELLYGMSLNVALTTPANSVITCGGWLFDLINTVSITISNSNMSALTLSGLSMRSLILAALDSKDKRIALLEAAGSPTPAATTARASIPIAWMINMGLGVQSGQYPIDMATISGSIQVNITFNASTSIVSRTGAIPEALTNFSDLYLTASTTQVLDPEFAVREAMIRDPSLLYSIPGKYLSYTRYTQSLAAGTASTIQIGSCPLGELQAIILTVKPVVELTCVAAGDVYYAGGCRLSQLQLDYAGQTLYRADNWQEHCQNMRERFQGDDKTYSYPFGLNNAVSAAATNQISSQVTIIPLCYSGNDVLQTKTTEYLPGYSGSTLSLTLTVASIISPSPGARGLAAPATPFFPAAAGPRGGGGAQNYIIECLFLLNSVLTVSTSSVEYHV